MLHLLLAICAVFPVFSSKVRSSIVVSEFTSNDLISEFFSLSSSSSDIVILNLANSNLASLESYRPNLIFDFSESLLYRKKVKEFASAHNIVFFSPRESSSNNEKGVFSLHPPPSTEADAIRSLLKYLEWPDFHVISSETERSRAVSSLLSSAPLDTLSNGVDQEIFDRYTAKVIKSSGNWKTVAINEEPGASKVFKSLENSRIYKERCGLIVSSKGSRGKFKLGTLGVVEEGLEEAQTEAQYQFKAILRAISISENTVRNFTDPVVNNDILLKGLEEETSNGIVSSRYSIVNFKDKWRIVGDIERQKIRTWEEIVFPGNVTEMNNSLPKISLSSHTGSLNPDGSVNRMMAVFSLGLQPMVSIVNNDPSILPNFELEVYETECPFDIFDLECAKKHLGRLGIVELAGINAIAIEENIRFLKENNITIPIVSLAYNNETIFDKNLFPEVLITMPSSLLPYSTLPYSLKSFGWDQAIAIFNNRMDPYYISVFLQNSESINLKILNTEKHMYVPVFKTENYYKEVEHILEFIHKSKCRIVLMNLDYHSDLYFMEALYDFGFRRGDLVLSTISPLNQAIDYPEQYFFDRKKVFEIADGTLIATIAEYIGEYGQKLEKQIAPLIYPYPTSSTCFQIDSLMLAARSIDLMIRNGKDFEDFEDLMFFMRGIQFTGCSGRIAIDSAGNGRRDIVFTIDNFYIIEDQWYQEIVGSYTHGVMIPLKIDKTIRWANGITDVPDDTIYDPECGFSPELVKQNTESLNLSLILTLPILGSVCILCVIIWRCCLYFKRDFLTEKREMYFEDGVLLYLPVLETAQFLALGPSFREANLYLAFLCSATIFEFDKIIDFEKHFWIIMSVVLGGCGLWCMSLCITYCKKEEILPQLLRDLFHVIGYTFIQVFSQLLFVSSNVLVLKIFDCKEGIGDELIDSFLKYDCRTSCWEGKHLSYVIVACIVLFVYNTFGIVCRVISDDLMEYVNVNTQPAYAIWKGIFQLTLVVLNFYLKDSYPITFAGIYCLLFVVWTMFVFRVDSYNYKRLNGWIKVFTASVLAHEILILGYVALDIPNLAVILLQVTILVLCLGIGLYVQFAKSSSMLYKRKARNFDKLLKFALTSRMKAKELTEHELDYVRQGEQYEIECS